MAGKKKAVTVKSKSRSISKSLKGRSSTSKGTKKYILYSAGGTAEYYKKFKEMVREESSYNNIESMVMIPSIAYGDSYYVHSYVANFEEAIQAMDLQQKIKNSLQSFMPELNSKLKLILEAVEPTKSEENAIEILEKDGDNALRKLFQGLKDNYGKFKTSFGRALRVETNKPKKTDENIAYEGTMLEEVKKLISKNMVDKLYRLPTSNEKQKIFVESIRESLLSEDGIIANLTSNDISATYELGNILAGNIKDKNSIESLSFNKLGKEVVEGVTNFLLLSQLLEKASKYTEENIRGVNGNKLASYNNAIESLNLWSQLKNAIAGEKTSFLELGASKFKRNFGLAFESIMGTMEDSKVVGQLDSKITSTDIELNYSSTIGNIDNTENKINASLKTGQLIYRTQNLNDFFISNKDEFRKNVLSSAKPLRYFLLNFGLLTEYQIERDKIGGGKFIDKNLMSSEVVMSIYNYIVSTLGRYYFTNTFVGFILKNWTNDANLKTLPKVVLNSNNNKYYKTYDLIKAVMKNKDSGGDGLYIHPAVTGEMLNTYADFIDKKSRSFAYLKSRGETLTYQNLLSHKAKGGESPQDDYKKFNQLSDDLGLFTVTDIAVIIEKQGAKIK